MGFRNKGLGFDVLGFRVWDYRIKEKGFGVWGLGCEIWAFGLWVEDVGFRV